MNKAQRHEHIPMQTTTTTTKYPNRLKLPVGVVHGEAASGPQRDPYRTVQTCSSSAACELQMDPCKKSRQRNKILKFNLSRFASTSRETQILSIVSMSLNFRTILEHLAERSGGAGFFFFFFELFTPYVAKLKCSSKN